MTGWSEERQRAGDNALDALHEARRRAGDSVRPRRRIRNQIESSPIEVELTSEVLGSVVVAGELHAAYPSALNALCGVRRGDSTVDHEGPPPGCGDCSMAAAMCAAIDNSAPPHWKIQRSE